MRKDIIKPIETEYNGYLFRSKLEAQWAVVFDSLEIRYEYEPEGFELEDGTRYLPDFYFPDQDTYGEVKPDRPGALEELFGKSLKFVENGTIERLIILPNIPAATKKDPVWWVPLIVKDPFVPFPFKDCPYSDMIITRAGLEKEHISMETFCTYEQVKGTKFDFWFYRNRIMHSDEGRKALRSMLLQPIPTRELSFLWRCADFYSEKIDFYLEVHELENKTDIMQAYQKARQARFDHGQAPEVKSAG